MIFYPISKAAKNNGRDGFAFKTIPKVTNQENFQETALEHRLKLKLNVSTTNIFDNNNRNFCCTLEVKS